MIQFKILKSSYYTENLDYSYKLPQINEGDHYINKDIQNFCMHNPDIDILDINVILVDRELLAIIKYKI